jgi:release factor glutamine methyltransferase
MRPTADSDPALVDALRRAGCVYAEEEARVLAEAARSPAHLADLLARRGGGEPLEQVVGWAEFAGLRVTVRPGVFVPRRRSELLAGLAAGAARAAQAAARREGRAARVLDLCCGTGALALVVAREAPGVDLTAVDLSGDAVACARENLAGTGCVVLAGDLFAPLEEPGSHAFDVIVANVPYVPAGEFRTLPAEARDHEPRQALDGGADGLDTVRRVLSEARPWLLPHGRLLVETSRPQGRAALRAARECGLRAELTTSELHDVSVLVAGLAV